MTLILVVDDAPAMAEQYAYDLRRLGGHEALTARNGEEALAVLELEPVDCVILDLEMPVMDGFATLRALARQGNDVPVIVYTGTGDFDACIQAVRLGAAGFIDKGEPMARVLQDVNAAIERSRLRREVAALQARLGDSSLLGSSSAMRALRKQIGRLAAIPSPVLITGESGTGKELVARDLHRLAPNASAPFIALNAAALPEQLVESELFGHERGAFTGAVTTRKGAFEAAGRGAVLLDEIGELPLPAQAKLLRVLEAREVSRVGSNVTIPVEARVLAATNRDLDVDVREGRFREDLLFRLNVHQLRVPSLRERREDVPQLAEHFMRLVCERFGILPRRIAPEAMEQLVAWDWSRNNVRELRNTVERMVVASDGEIIRSEHVPPEIRGEPAPAEAGEPVTFEEQRRAAERRIVLAALEKHEWHITRTAEALGLADHSSLIKLLKRLGVERVREDTGHDPA